MRSIKAGSVLAGMLVTMMTWYKPNDRRPEEVMVESVEGEKKSLVLNLLTERGDRFSVAHNGDYVAFNASGEELRVTFQIDDAKNTLFGVDGNKQVVLSDKNGETATWNTIGKDTWQLPDDEACGSSHTSSELALQGYRVADVA